MLSQAVRLTLRTTSATGFSQAVAMDLDDGKLCMACRGSAVRIRLAPLIDYPVTDRDFSGLHELTFLCNTAKYHS